MKKRSKQDLKKVQEVFAEFVTTIKMLRHPKTGCPWDLEQTHESLRPFMLEEAYEAVEAAKIMSDSKVTKNKGKDNLFCDELGDVLLQVVLNAQIASEKKCFSIVDVVDAINTKILRRHPHVFGQLDSKHKIKSAGQVREQWDKIKADEKKAKKNKGQKFPDPKGIFEKAEKSTFPSTMQALKIGKIAESIKFDWKGPKPVLKQLFSEVHELERELVGRKRIDLKRARKEIGDVYFTLAQLCRHLEINPEVAAMDGNKKFLKRFKHLEKIAVKKKIDLCKADMNTLEDLWAAAKKRES